MEPKYVTESAMILEEFRRCAKAMQGRQKNHFRFFEARPEAQTQNKKSEGFYTGGIYIWTKRQLRRSAN